MVYDMARPAAGEDKHRSNYDYAILWTKYSGSSTAGFWPTCDNKNTVDEGLCERVRAKADLYSIFFNCSPPKVARRIVLRVYHIARATKILYFIKFQFLGEQLKKNGL
eukprot:sb/3477512/